MYNITYKDKLNVKSKTYSNADGDIFKECKKIIDGVMMAMFSMKQMD